jgi:predicted Rossmann fold nucleotide-binding protein DprA/Smf involved in DNA uptake
MSSINMMAEMSKPIFVVPTPFTEDAINNEILLEGAFFAKDGKEIIKQLKWD